MSEPDGELVGMLETMAQELRSVQLDVDFQKRETEALVKLIADLEILRGKARGGLPEVHTTADQPWRCPCGTMLGLYDGSEDLLRIRSERIHMIIKLGPGGYLKRTCHRCGRIVTATQDPDQPAPAPGS